MAAPKAIKDLTGNTPTAARLGYGPPSTPLDLGTVAAALIQLQNSLNELIVRYNAHTHTENTAGAYTQNATTGVPSSLVNGTPQTAANLFTAS